MTRIALAFVLLFALTGCRAGGAITCPTVRVYSPAFLKATSAELDMIEKNAPHVVQMLNDYGVERDAIRKCLALQSSSH